MRYTDKISFEERQKGSEELLTKAGFCGENGINDRSSSSKI